MKWPWVSRKKLEATCTLLHDVKDYSLHQGRMHEATLADREATIERLSNHFDCLKPGPMAQIYNERGFPTVVQVAIPAMHGNAVFDVTLAEQSRCEYAECYADNMTRRWAEEIKPEIVKVILDALASRKD